MTKHLPRHSASGVSDPLTVKAIAERLAAISPQIVEEIAPMYQTGDEWAHAHSGTGAVA